MGESYGFCEFGLMEGEGEWEQKTSRARTEELAELQAIIQAIEYERRTKSTKP